MHSKLKIYLLCVQNYDHINSVKNIVLSIIKKYTYNASEQNIANTASYNN